MSVDTKDKIILQALRSGDEKAFEKVYADYYHQLSLYLYRLSLDKEKSEDIIQDIFMYLWNKREKINITISLKSYLFKIANNKLNDWHRINKKKNKMLSIYTYAEKIQTTKFNEDTASDTNLEKLDACICELPPKCKDVFVANKIDGRKYREVASDMNISVKTVENHVSKAYKILRSCMVHG